MSKNKEPKKDKLTGQEKEVLEAKPSAEADRASIKWPKIKKWKTPTREGSRLVLKPTTKYHPGTKEAREALKLAGRSLDICSNCGSSHRVSIHHKDGNPYNNQLDNLMILCADCHAREHGRKLAGLTHRALRA